MKKFYLIRHAKSSWAEADLNDFDRPLNKRGERDAPFMAKLLVEQGIKADAIISSPAKRALSTAKEFAKAQQIKVGDIIEEKEIYEAYPTLILDIIKNLDDKLNTVFLFGHNPGLTHLANTFKGNYIPNIPTCGIVELSADVDKWKDIDETNTIKTAFHFPKQYF